MHVLMRGVRQKLPRTILQKMVIAFLASATLTVIVLSQPTHALPLTDTVNQIAQPLNSLLSPLTSPLVRPQAQQQAPQAAAPSSNNYNSPTTTPSGSAVAPSSQSAQASSPVTPAGLPAAPSLNPAPLEQIQPISRKYLASSRDSTKFANVLVKNPGTTSPVADFALIRATENGWQLFGILWYWWLVIIAAVGVVGWGGHRLYRRSGTRKAYKL